MERSRGGERQRLWWKRRSEREFDRPPAVNIPEFHHPEYPASGPENPDNPEFQGPGPETPAPPEAVQRMAQMNCDLDGFGIDRF